MTAPPAERASTRAKWAARLVRVDSHLTQAYVHREIWQALRDEIVRTMQLCGVRGVREIGPDLVAEVQ